MCGELRCSGEGLVYVKCIRERSYEETEMCTYVCCYVASTLFTVKTGEIGSNNIEGWGTVRGPYSGALFDRTKTFRCDIEVFIFYIAIY